MKPPLVTTGICTPIALLGGLGLAALSGKIGADGDVAAAGALSWLGGVAGNQFQAWLGSKIKDPPPGAEEVFKNHHIRAVIGRAVVAAVEKKSREIYNSRGNASDLFRDAGELLADRLGELVDEPAGPFADLRDFNVTAILNDFVAHEGNVRVLTLALWTALLDDTPKLDELSDENRTDLAAGLYDGFGEALWGIFKNDAANDRQAFAALELLYLSRILQSVQARPEITPPDLSPVMERINALFEQIGERQRTYFVVILGGIALVRETQSIHTGLLREILTAVTLTRPTPNTLHTLPPPPRGFTGREKELEDLRKTAGQSGTVITGLKGMGGIGKTALARVLAWEWSARFPDAALELDGQGLNGAAAPNGTGLLEMVIRAFLPDRKNLPEDEVSLRGIYLSLLYGKKALILLDNARDAAQARSLLPPEGCALIVTSRTNFMIDGCAPYAVGKLKNAEAKELLCSAYPALTEEDATELVRLCAGLPLALRLVAAHLKLDAGDCGGVADVSGYLGKLRSGRLAHLDAEAEDAGEVAISETLRLSVELLPENQRQSWANLAIFTADFDAQAAGKIAGVEREMLTSFLRRSLLEPAGPERYKLHDLAAEYARGYLSANVIADLTLAHAGHYTAIGICADDLYLKGDVGGGLALFDRERAQIEAAWSALVARQDDVAAWLIIRLVRAIAYVSNLRFHPRQSIVWLESHLGAARRIGDRNMEGYALGNIGLAYSDMGDSRKAIEYYEERLEIARQIGDRRGEGNSLGNLGNSHADLGDARKALEYHENALVVSREIEDRRGEGIDLGNLGIAHKNLGDVQKAIGYHQQCLEIAREIRDRRGQGNALGNLGIAHAELGDTWKALGYYEEQLTIGREIGHRRAEGNALFYSAEIYESLGERVESLRRAEAALKIFEAIEHPNTEEVRNALKRWKSVHSDGTNSVVADSQIKAKP